MKVLLGRGGGGGPTPLILCASPATKFRLFVNCNLLYLSIIVIIVEHDFVFRFFVVE